MIIGVTGSSGFIATYTIVELKKRGHQVIGFQRSLGAASPADKIYIGDLKDKEAVERFVSKCEGVINLAGLLGTKETVNNPYPSVEVNILGGLNVLEACRIWGVPLVQIAVGNHWMNNSYSISRTTCERFALMYAKEHNVKVNVVRALNAFGPGQSIFPVKKIIPTFTVAALTGEGIPVFGDGKQLMDMISVKDLAAILVDTLLNESKYGQILEAGTGVGLEVEDIAKRIIKLTNSKSKIKYLPMREGEEPNSKVVAQDPVKFKYTDFDVALKETVEYYQSLYKPNA